MKSKIIFIGLLSLASFLTSCKKDETTSIDSNAAESSMSESSLAKLTELALMSAKNEAGRDSTGRHERPCKLTEIGTGSLPPSVTTYITSNYADATIERAGENQAGHYLIAIKKADGTVSGLIFDATGVFLNKKALRPHPDLGSPVEIASLPGTITIYIADTYAGSTIEKANLRSDREYVVLIKKPDASLTALAFDANGNFLIELPVPLKKVKRHRRK